MDEKFDKTLLHRYLGGPLDGRKSADLPPQLSGKKLTGIVLNTPLSQPARFSLFAVYECVSETQVDGFWSFQFVKMAGPNGELIVALESELAQV